MVAPSLARQGDVLSVDLAFTDVPQAVPRVWMVDAAGAWSEWVVTAVDRRTFRGEAVASGLEAEGNARLLMDVRMPGRALLLVPLGAVRLDYTAPRVVNASLRLVPSPSNDLVAGGGASLLTAMRGDTQATLEVVLDEQTGTEPVLTVQQEDGGRALVTARRETAAVAWDIRPPVASPDVDGLYTATVSLADRAGNRRTQQVAKLDVKTMPSPPPQVEIPGALVFTRAPTGTLEQESAGFWVRAAPGAVPEAVLLVALYAGGVVGVGRVDGDAGVASQLLTLTADADTIQVASVDRAGNRSAAVRVADLEWVATARTLPDGGSLVTGEPLPAFIQGPRALGGSLRAPATTSGGWVESVDESTHPSPQFPAHSGCLVRTNQGLVSSMGYVLSSRIGNFERALPLLTSCVPTAFDWAKHAVVQVTNVQGSAENQTTPAVPEGHGLPARTGFALAFSPLHGGVVAYGGQVAHVTDALAETWVLSLDAGWSALNAGGPALSDPALVWDGRGGRLLLVGGRKEDGGASGETWALGDGGWARLQGASLSPAWSRGVAAALDDGTVVASGGVNSAGGVADTWRLEGDGWSRLPQGELPPGRVGQTLYWDARAGGFVVAGVEGLADGGAVADTWFLMPDAGWRRRGTASVGAARPYDIAAILMEPEERVVASTGWVVAAIIDCGPDCYSTYLYRWAPQTWFFQLDGGWRAVDGGPVLTADGGLFVNEAPGLLMAWDPVNRATVAWSGDGTFSRLQSDGTWLGGVLPSLPQGSGLVWDDTWGEWAAMVDGALYKLRGAGWAVQDRGAPQGGRLVSSVTFGGLVLAAPFGVYRWTGGGWVLATRADPGTSGFDTDWGMVASMSGGTALLTPAGSVPFILSSVNGGSTTLVGTKDHRRLLGLGSRSWSIFDSSGATPAQGWAVSIAPAHVPSGATWLSAGLRVKAGGVGFDGVGSRVPGARVRLFSDSWYRPVATGTGDLQAREVVQWSSHEGAELYRLLDREVMVGFGVEALGPNGGRPGFGHDRGHRVQDVLEGAMRVGLFAGLWAVVAAAQPVRVLDLNIDRASTSSSPQQFTAVDAGVIFVATDRRGQEVWFSDGTAEGTQLFLDAAPGELSGSCRVLQERALDGRSVVGCGGGARPTFLLTDGTATGSTVFRNAPYNPLAYLGNLILALRYEAGRVILTANDEDGGERQLGQYARLPQGRLGNVAEGVVFEVVQVDGGPATVWTDGAQVLTGGALPAHGYALQLGALTLAPMDGGLGVLTGTPSAPQLKLLLPSVGGGVLPLGTWGTTGLFTSAGWPLFRTDGTPGGTVALTGPLCGVGTASVVGERLYFQTVDPVQGAQVQVRDATGDGGVCQNFGTPAAPGACFSRDNFLELLTADGRRVLGFSNDGVYDLGSEGRLLFKVGQRYVPSPHPQPIPPIAAAVNGVALYQSCLTDSGCELHASTGVRSSLLKDLWWTTESSSPAAVRVDPSTDERLVLGQQTDGGGSLCRISARDGGVRCLRDLLPPAGPPTWTSNATLVPVWAGGVKALYSTLGDTGKMLETDGLGEPLTGPEELAPMGQVVVLVASTPSAGRELFVTGGTSSTTHLLKDISPGSEGSNPTPPVLVGSLGFFAATDAMGRSPWVTDGTGVGTLPLATAANKLAGSAPTDFVALSNGWVAFAANVSGRGRELYVSDGTAAHTMALAELAPGPVASAALPLGQAGATVVTSAQVGDAGEELWLVPLDGGVPVMVDVWPGPASSTPRLVGVVAGGVLFSASDPDAGRELWLSNGSVEGTKLLDLNHGPAGSAPSLGLVVGERVYFAAARNDVGTELFVSDGVTAELAGEVADQALSSWPSDLSWVGAGLYFTATDTAGDREAWVLPLKPELDNTPPRVTAWVEGALTDAGWYRSDVTVKFTVEDPDSPVQLSGCDGGLMTEDTKGMTATCSATSAGGRAQASVSWRRDTTPPTLTCPTDLALTAGDGGVAVGMWEQRPPRDDLDPQAELVSSRRSGSTFSVGRTTVVVSATDEAGNASTCQFDVTVLEAPAAVPTQLDHSLRSGCGCSGHSSSVAWVAVLMLALRRRWRET